MIEGANHSSASESAAAATSFCQHCGRPLNAATARVVGAAVYCEPCLAARMAASQPAPSAHENVGQAGVRSTPNPGIATLLGFIPGVGAMYNEQYAKGIVHLMIFAVLVVLSDNVNGIFGIFIAGWEFYMAIEAHHTARARRDRTMLPNPFGLNDVGERWGFGKAWPAGAQDVASVFHDAANAATHAAQQLHSSPPPAPWAQTAAAPPYAPVAEARTENFGDWSHAASSPGPGAGHEYAQNSAAGTQEPWRTTFHPAASPAGYDAAMPVPAGGSRFPAGAVLLIGAGVFFLFATTGVFSFVNKGVMTGLGLLGLAVWMFVRCMLHSGTTLGGDGSAGFGLRTLRASRGAAWVGLTGVLFLASTLHLLGWNHSWPLYIILGGVLGFAERAVPHPVAVYPPLPPTL